MFIFAASLARASSLLFVVAAASATAQTATAQGVQPCRRQAYSTLVSCKSQAHADLWELRARCENVASPQARSACFASAYQEYQDTLALCGEQFSERNAVCNELGIGFYDPDTFPSSFVPVIDNPYLPLIPGTAFHYEKPTAEGLEEIDVTVTYATVDILGIECVVVHDVVTLEGAPIEDTFDWYAQDAEGNVWYMGESVNDYDETGRVNSTEGSWLAGVDGAKPGIVMPGAPQIGELYRQEYLINEAEDVFEIVSLSQLVTVPYGAFSNCLMSEDFSPVAPGIAEHKYYAPGVGKVLELNLDTGEQAQLISIATF